jgi:cytoskeletal protein CcmA (bactofilin family)
VIGEDLIIQGELKSRGEIEVLGYVTGAVTAERLTVHRSGRVIGTVRAGNAEVNGLIQGSVAVRHLISIGATGTVSGDVRYGQLSLAPGGDLSAEVRNVPPEIAGDLQLVVRRARSVRITTEDLDAIDPDTRSEALVYQVTRPMGGHVARAETPAAPIERFTEKDIETGAVVFVHDGRSAKGSIDVVVTDDAGGSSGLPRTVEVAVLEA